MYLLITVVKLMFRLRNIIHTEAQRKFWELKKLVIRQRKLHLIRNEYL